MNGCGCGLFGFVLVFILVVFSMVGNVFQSIRNPFFDRLPDFGSNDSYIEEIIESIAPDDGIGMEKDRVPLDESLCIETEYYEDTVGVISDSEQMMVGMKQFYARTGVQPYVYFVDGETCGADADSDGELTYEEASDFAYEAYVEKFEDEGHFLLVIFVYGGDVTDSLWVDMVGSFAYEMGPLDDGALTLLEENIDRYLYDYAALGPEKALSMAFGESAARIMPGESPVLSEPESELEVKPESVPESKPEVESKPESEIEPEVESKPEVEEVPSDEESPEESRARVFRNLLVGIGTVALIAVVVILLCVVLSRKMHVAPKDEQ